MINQINIIISMINQINIIISLTFQKAYIMWLAFNEIQLPRINTITVKINTIYWNLHSNQSKSIEKKNAIWEELQLGYHLSCLNLNLNDLKLFSIIFQSSANPQWQTNSLKFAMVIKHMRLLLLKLSKSLCVAAGYYLCCL